MKVAVAQLDAGHGHDRALTEAVEAVHAAADAGAALVVLPEYASGWAAHLGPDLTVPTDGAFVAALQDAARQRGIAVVAGIIAPGHEAAGDGSQGRAVNVALAIGPDGALRGDYAKVHLFDAFGSRESDALVAGDPAAEPLVFELEGLRFGVETCYDLRFPESTRRLTDAGAQVVVAIAAWASGPGKVDQLGVLARARALENTAYLLLASQHGAGRSGHSAVVDPLGVVLAEAGDASALLLAELDPARVAQVRSRLPVLDHRRYDVVPRA